MSAGPGTRARGGGGSHPPIERIGVPTPFTVGPVNAYLIRDDPVTLVDCGPLTPEAWDALLRGLRRAGVPPGRIERLVLTHPHHDHAGLARRVREASGCPVLAHPVDRERLLDAPGAWEAIAGFLVEVCRRAGVPPGLREALEQTMEGLRQYTEPLDGVEPLGEGDVLEGAGGPWQVLHTPGHARGALCLWHPSSGTLVSGDTLIPHISSNAILEPGADRFREHTLPQYLAALGRIRALGSRRVLPGHGDPMGPPDALIDERLAFHRARCREILSRVEGGAGPVKPWDIARELFRGADPGYVFLAVSEVVGHLDLLARQGLVRFEGQEGVWLAEPAR